MQTLSSSACIEEIINKGSDILSVIRGFPIQKHFTNILCCHIESFHIVLLQSPWVKAIKPEENLQKIFENVIKILSSIKKYLGELEKGDFFKEIGLNTNFSKIISTIVSLFDTIPKLFKETTLYKKLQEEELNFQNLDHELNFIDSFTQKLKEKFKNYKNLIKSSNNFPPGELAIIFDLSTMATDECTISWLSFASKLTSFIYDLQKIELKAPQLAQIRKLVDALKVSAISFDNLNYFFNYLWIKTSERRAILNPQEPKNMAESVNLVDEYPALILTYQNKPLKIHPRGFDSPLNANYRGDGITYFGRKSQQNNSLNDFNLPENDLTVSRRQFQIVYQEEKKRYVVLCISNSNPTMFKVNETKMRLKLGSLFQLSDTQIFKVEAISYKKEKNPAQYLYTPEEVQKKFDNDMKNQGGAARKALENKIDVLAESMYLSVLVLDPPDMDVNLNNTTNKTFQKGHGENKTEFVNFNMSSFKQNKDCKSEGGKPQQNQAPLQPAMQPTTPFLELLCLKGNNLKRSLIVSNPKVTQVFSVGRKNDNDIVVDSQEISSIHCQIMFDAKKDAWYIGEKLTKFQEKNSFNGTFLFCKDHREYLMKRPSQSRKLREGMILKVGAHEFSVHCEDQF